MTARVLVAMSGGVDSSVAAARLVEQGYDVVGATMKLFCYGEEVPDRPCCSLDSINDARDVADGVGYPALRPQSRGPVQSARDSELRERVQPRPDTDPLRALQFVHQVPRPPGPRRCPGLRVHRNRTLCRSPGTAHSTGARIRPRTRATSSGESTRAVVARMLTPIGSLSKPETRAYARRLGLTTAEKQESVEICFVPNDDYVGSAGAASPSRRAGTQPRASGYHRRRGHRRAPGLRAATPSASGRGSPAASTVPRYVVEIRPERREVVVGGADDLAGHRVTLEELNWLADPLEPGERCQVQLRYRARAAQAVVLDKNSDQLVLALETPRPGHYAWAIGRPLRT